MRKDNPLTRQSLVVVPLAIAKIYIVKMDVIEDRDSRFSPPARLIALINILTFLIP